MLTATCHHNRVLLLSEIDAIRIRDWYSEEIFTDWRASNSQKLLSATDKLLATYQKFVNNIFVDQHNLTFVSSALCNDIYRLVNQCDCFLPGVCSVCVVKFVLSDSEHRSIHVL